VKALELRGVGMLSSLHRGIGAIEARFEKHPVRRSSTGAMPRSMDSLDVHTPNHKHNDLVLGILRPRLESGAFPLSAVK
jgi:hypothetical protein